MQFLEHIPPIDCKNCDSWLWATGNIYIYFLDNNDKPETSEVDFFLPLTGKLFQVSTVRTKGVEEIKLQGYVSDAMLPLRIFTILLTRRPATTALFPPSNF